MSQDDVTSALKRYHKHADMLRSPLDHLLQHLSVVAQNPHELRIDWSTVVEAFLSFDKRLEDACKEIQDKKEILQHTIVFPGGRPPPFCDVPLLLSSRDHLEMEIKETEVTQAFKEAQDKMMDTTTEGTSLPAQVSHPIILSMRAWTQPGPKVTSINQEVDKLMGYFTSQAALAREAMDACSNPHLKEKPWRAHSKEDVESAHKFLEDFREGRLMAPPR